MKTSVIIATYNGARFIEEQLNSIFHQTVLPSEIVISDDGSTDSTIELVQSVFRQHQNLPISMKLLHNFGSHGVLGNFQNAAMNANGDYIFFCDQDDIWLPNKIERLVDILDSCDEQVVIHNAQVIQETTDGSFQLIDRYLMGSHPFDSDGLFKIDGQSEVWFAFYCCAIQGMCMCVKRDYLLSLLPFSKGINHDNWILFCAAADNSLLAVSDILAHYRVHDNNTCGISDLKKRKPLSKKLASFDQQGRSSIINQYTWYMDTSTYLGTRPILDEKIRQLISFFTKERITDIAQNKIRATKLLYDAYKQGVYSIDGKIVFIHDLAYVWMHTRKARLKLVSQLESNLRH